jgi:hypothetical protein
MLLLAIPVYGANIQKGEWVEWNNINVTGGDYRVLLRGGAGNEVAGRHVRISRSTVCHSRDSASQGITRDTVVLRLMQV